MKILNITLLTILTFLILGCSDLSSPEQPNELKNISGLDVVNTHDCHDPNPVPHPKLWTCGVRGGITTIMKAGRNGKPVGELEYGSFTNPDLEFENTTMTITFVPYDEYEFTEVHLWVGESIDDLPTAKNGTPKIGHFPYSSTETPYEFEVPATNPMVVVAHAVVEGPDVKGDTAFGGENEGSGPRWWWWENLTFLCAYGEGCP